MSQSTSDTKPNTIVIFGASGDLTHRKLIPALYNNYKKGRLLEGTRVVGFARRPWSDEDWASHNEGWVAGAAAEMTGQASSPEDSLSQALSDLMCRCGTHAAVLRATQRVLRERGA